jgi:DNA-binding NarL/FixJ family response regulator
MISGARRDPVSILLVDRSPVIELGLRQLLEGTPFTITDRVEGLVAARRCLTSQSIQLVLSDYVLRDGSVSDLAMLCDREGVPLVLFTAWQHPQIEAAAARNGVRGLINKRSPGPAIVEALQQSAGGHALWSRQDRRRLGAAMVADQLASHLQFPLTRRELEVLRCLAEGNSNRKIADRLDIAFETAKEHVQNLLAKLGVSDRTQAAVLAQRHGLL